MVLTNYLMQTYAPYEPPISPTSFLHLTLLFIITGLVFMAWFFTVEVTTHSTYGGSAKESGGSKILKEMVISFFGSLFLGIGAVFLILSIGVYI